MFKTRLLSGIFLVVILVGLGILGGYYFGAFCAVLSFFGFWEFSKMVGEEKKLLGILGLVLTGAIYLFLFLGYPEKTDLVVALSLLLFMTVYVVTYPKLKAEQIFASYTGWIYAAVFLSYLYRLRLSEHGMLLVWLVFLGSWGSDTFAYCTGMLFGKHKAFPKLSPKKSVEGCIGGAVGAAILAVVYAIIVNQMYSDISVFIPGFALLGFLASVVSQIGDLAASAMKRNFGIKDYGKLIPGHGGVLDRFDSVIFTAPLVYFFSQYLFR